MWIRHAVLIVLCENLDAEQKNVQTLGVGEDEVKTVLSTAPTFVFGKSGRQIVIASSPFVI